MGKWLMRLGVAGLAVAVLIMTGCPPKEAADAPKEPVTERPTPPVPSEKAEPPVEKEPIPIPVSETMAPSPKSIPETKFPESLQETNLVSVGDVFPLGEATTVDGQKQSLADLLGKKGTVVFFWTAGSSEIAQMTAAQALGDLQGDAQAPYGDQGLAVVALNPKDPAQKVKDLLAKVQVAYPVLVDDGGACFAKVAKSELPRVYVLDGAGKILWFDVEFSEVSREDLKKALQFMFGTP